MIEEAFIALGSNLGDRRRAIARAIRRIQALDGVRVTRVASIIETDPIGPEGQGPYMNTAIRIETELGPRELLDHLLEIEIALGRDRTCTQRWGPRIIDLDVLIYSDEIIDEPGLEIPHPRLHERGFVLIPLAQIAPDLIVPGAKLTPRALLHALLEA